MNYRQLRLLIREALKKSKDLITEPEHSEDEDQSEASFGGVAGAHSVSRQVRKKKIK